MMIRSSSNLPSNFLKSCHFENKILSTTNILQIDWILSGKSLIYVKKRSGLETDPCGTPERTLSQEKVWLLGTTPCLESVK